MDFPLKIFFFLTVLFVYVLFNFEYFKDVSKLEAYQRFSTSKCHLLNGTQRFAPMEDLKLVTPNIAIGAASSLASFYEHGDKIDPLGNIIAFDLTTERLKVLSLNDFPHLVVFRPHGIHYSERTKRLFVVNHANNGEERIEIFSVKHLEDLEALEIQWIDFLNPPGGKGVVNSVTEVSDKQIYLTHSLPYPIPEGGMLHPESFQQFLQLLWGSGVFWKALGLPPHLVGSTYVFFCDIETKRCGKLPAKFISANGIGSSADGSLLFVADTMRQTLTVFEKQNRNALAIEDEEAVKWKVKKIEILPHTVDNLQVVSLGNHKFEIWMGTSPDLIKTLKSISVGNVTAPGGFSKGLYDETTNKLEVEDILIHDGSFLSGTSSSIAWKNQIVFSSPKTPGVLICSCCD